MSRYRKVVWNEGMLLTPHHFQQSDNYQEELLNSRLNSVVPYGWGILELQINSEAIANGYFEIVHCQAVMPDGLVVNIPEADTAPDARPIEGRFDAAAESLDVYLSIPAKRVGAINFQANGGEGGQMPRYLQQVGVVVDETNGENEQQMAFARGNFRILFADELRDGYSAIKIARLERTATGQLALSEKYIPPVLKLSASKWLFGMLSQIIEILIRKSSTLGEQRRQSAASLGVFNMGEVAPFWLLHTVNSAIPTLRHLFHTPLVHPERLYLEMARVEGELMTFATDRHPRDIVAYDHKDLFLTFSRLNAEIRDLLERVIPTRCVAIPLEQTRETLYVGRVHDDQLLKNATFFLGVGAQIAENRLIERVPRVVKIAALDVINTVVGAALPGVMLTHASPPPAPIPTRLGFHYFGLENRGPSWEEICDSKNLAIHVPQEFPDVKLEMYAIKP
ncbi:MAG: type secretion system protein ImpJ [Blastocatellia bacterium]